VEAGVAAVLGPLAFAVPAEAGQGGAPQAGRHGQGRRADGQPAAAGDRRCTAAVHCGPWPRIRDVLEHLAPFIPKQQRCRLVSP